MLKIKVKKDKNRSYTAAELHAACEKARREERQAQDARGETDRVSTRKLRKRLARVEGELEALQESTKTGKLDPRKLADRLFAKWEEKHEGTSSEEASELKLQVDKLEKEVKKSRMQRLRAKLIAENGGEDAMIVEMVRGETKEELKASIKKAVDAFDRYATKGKKDDDEDEEDDESEESEDDDEEAEDEDDETPSSTSKGRQAARELPTSSTSRSSEKGGKGKGLLKHVGTMSPADYAAKRTEILAETKRRYSGGASPFRESSKAGGR